MHFYKLCEQCVGSVWIYLNPFIFVRIIRDPASPEVSVRVFNESLQMAFPNNELVSKFHNE